MIRAVLRFAQPERRAYMPYGKKRTSAAEKRKKNSKWRVPTSPSRRKEPWITIVVKAPTYAMLRELAEYNGKSLGEVVRVMTELEFQKTLWKVQQEELKAQRGANP
jgi:hypothetical protein